MLALSENDVAQGYSTGCAANVSTEPNAGGAWQVAQEQSGGDAYLTAEARARVDVDRQLNASGWVVQKADAVNLKAGRGVAVREFILGDAGRADYLLFADGEAVGAIEAKPAGTTLTGVEEQSARYTTGAPDWMRRPFERLPFTYEATGVETRFTNFLDPDPRSRGLFSFHRPETLADWVREAKNNPEAPTLRCRLRNMPPLDAAKLWPPQERAIRSLESSLAQERPRALIQMTMGAGKTFTAANISYRLVKYAGARRVLFLVDRANLGRQTLNEFQAFEPPEDLRKFTELYNVQQLSSNRIDPVARVCIGTIQRMYSILRGETELPSELDEESAYELEPASPVPVAYSPTVPPETFDVVIVDECHRSIYNLWRQVLEYFDATIIGLTATPSKQTFGFFHQNLVMEYSYEQAVADGVNVDHDIYRIKTEITERGSTVDSGVVTAFRDRQTRAQRWSQLDEPVAYAATALDRAVVAQDQLRTVIQAFKDKLFSDIFPGRTDVPKTLIFAKDDSHADDVVQMVREVFGRGNEFCVKITYRTTGAKTDDLIASFRNSYYPRVAVTVDMIATGTDVKPLECVFFLRSVRSRTFFEQMKGRGARVINPTDFQQVTTDAKTKTRFVLVDAVGVTEVDLAETQPLDRKPGVPFDRILKQVSYGNREADILSSLAGRLAHLDRRITKRDRDDLAAAAGGRSLAELAGALVEALDPDTQFAAAQRASGTDSPSPEDVSAAALALADAAVEPIASNPALREKMLDVRRSYEQMIDEVSKDEVIEAGYSEEARERARALVTSFRDYIEANKDEVAALQVLYSRPYAQRITFRQIKELANAIKRPPRNWTPERLWAAYETLDRSKVRGSGKRMLTDIVSLVRYALQQEDLLVPFAEEVEERFRVWLAQQEQAGRRFTREQLQWLEWMKDAVASDIGVSRESFEYTPFVERGGMGKAFEVFGSQLQSVIDELTEVLSA